MIILLLKIISFGFLVNLGWEVPHSLLYTTCHQIPLKKYVPLILNMSAKDGFFIALFYSLTVLLWRNWQILQNSYQLGCFILIALSFAFIDERISTAKKRWEYAPAMPRVFGVGLTPFLEIAVTGVLTFLLIF